MALTDYFLEPLGLVALASIVPLVILYLLRPKPARVALPTMRFLFADDPEQERSAIIRALQRDWLLLVQLFVLVCLSLALASPYVAVAEERVIDERVIVVDASASMAAETDGSTRFDRARQLARDRVTETTSVVLAGPSPTVVLRGGPGPEARRTLESLSASHAAGDLAGAIDRATSVASSGTSIVVISDFVDGSDWPAALATARARGYQVDVQVVGGRLANVGIVDVDFEQGSVAATVENFGSQRATRSVSLGGRATSVELGPGGTATVRFPIPANGGELRLTPADRFPVDDRVPIAAPSDATIDVVLLTNDENRFLTTALSLIDDVTLTIRRPPATITQPYDVVIFSNVDPTRVLPGNIQTAREVLRQGGGVVIQAQPALRSANYGDLLLVEPTGMANGSTVEVADDPLTRGITFPAPERYVVGERRAGRSLVTAADGSPIVATDSRDGGRILYYGFIEDASVFKFNYMYPVFWKRAIYAIAGRPSLASLNHETGARLEVGNRSVDGPEGPLAGPAIRLERVGFYQVGDQRHAAALLDRSESNVTAAETAVSGATGTAGERTEERQVPYDLTPVVAGLALLVGLLEIGLLRRRGDL